MTPLSRRESEFLTRYIRDALLLLWSYGYKVVVEDDLSKLAHRFHAHDQLFYAAFDPAAQAPIDDGFWVNVRHNDGETVCTHANAVFRDADFAELLASGRLWGTVGQNGRTEGLWDGPSQPIVGDVGHGGCMWVRPDYRGRGLVGPVHSLSMALAVWRMGIEFHTGLMYANDLETGLMSAYGYRRAEKCIDGYCSALDKAVELHAVWFTRGEILADLADRELHPSELRSATSAKLHAEDLRRDRQHLEQVAAIV